MKNKSRTIALIGAFVLLLLASAAAGLIGQSGPRPLGQPLVKLPGQLGPWHIAKADARLDQRTLEALQPNDYLMRTYVRLGGFPCSVYIAFFDSQEEGRMIHSPLQCLPGGGWIISQKDKVVIDGPFGPQTINHLTLSHNLNHMSVLYWFQGRGRIQHNEYIDRALLAWDNLSKGRSDGALVRLMSPQEQGARKLQIDLASRISKALQTHMDGTSTKQEGR